MMTMKTIKIVLLGAALAAVNLWFPTTAEAQCIAGNSVTCTTRTTLTADVAATDRVINVTSNTDFTVGNYVWVDFELMGITAISGTQITVTRGQRGTRAEPHDNADAVFTGTGSGGSDGAGHFHVNDPAIGQDCTRGQGQATHLPWVNIRTGWIFTCDNGVTADWIATQKGPRTLNSEPSQF